jgi:hypothetical protein
MLLPPVICNRAPATQPVLTAEENRVGPSLRVAARV